MNEQMRDALNEQVGRELQAAYLYLSLSDWFEGDQSLPGFASWMRHQAEEELEHAMRIVEHLQDRGARVRFGGLEAPPHEFESPLAAVRRALEHEREVTRHIHELYDLAGQVGDPPSRVMLEWFVEEQVEEEGTFGRLVDQMERAGDSGSSLLVLDAKLADRGGA